MARRRNDDSSNSDVDDSRSKGVAGIHATNVCLPLCFLIAINVVLYRHHRDTCTQPLGNFLIGCAVVYAIAIWASFCGVGTAHMRDNPIAKVVAFLNSFSGIFLFIWLICGIYWLCQAREYPSEPVLGNPHFCNKTIYRTSLAIVIISFIWLPCVVSGIVCGLCFAGKREEEDSDSEDDLED